MRITGDTFDLPPSYLLLNLSNPSATLLYVQRQRHHPFLRRNI
jgi:hypothetical protein